MNTSIDKIRFMRAIRTIKHPDLAKFERSKKKIFWRNYDGKHKQNETFSRNQVD